MSVVSSIVTAAFTALFGTIVFVIGQIVLKMFIEPIQEQRKVIGEVEYYLALVGHMSKTDHVTLMAMRHDTKPMYPMEPMDTFTALWKLAARLQSSLRVIPCYGFLERCGWVQSRASVITIISHLPKWANNVSGGDPAEHQEAIRQALQV